MKKKTVSLLLSLAMCLTMLPGQSVFAAETSTETETEAASESTGNHVENLIVGTIADQNVFNSLTQTDAFGRMNYNGFTQGDFVYRDENNNAARISGNPLRSPRMENRLISPFRWMPYGMTASR